MSNNQETKQIPDEVIAICAVNAALKTPGVEELFGGFSNTLSKNLLGKELISKGVNVYQGDSGVVINVHIVAEFGCKIPAVAWEVQENVKKEVTAITNLRVSEVNIHVEGVKKSTKGEEEDD